MDDKIEIKVIMTRADLERGRDQAIKVMTSGIPGDITHQAIAGFIVDTIKAGTSDFDRVDLTKCTDDIISSGLVAGLLLVQMQQVMRSLEEETAEMGAEFFDNTNDKDNG